MSFLLFACGGGGGDNNSGGRSITIDAGADQTVSDNSEVILAGSTSGATSVMWAQVSGTPVTLINAGTDTASFIAPDVSLPEILVFSFMGLDTDGRSTIDTVSITVDINDGFTKYENEELPTSATNWSCVIDDLRGLMIARDFSAGVYTWQQAMNYAASSDLCGFYDWRLSDRYEGMSQSDPDYFGQMWFGWTAEDALTPFHAWAGTDSNTSYDKTLTANARLVRDY